MRPCWSFVPAPPSTTCWCSCVTFRRMPPSKSQSLEWSPFRRGISSEKITLIVDVEVEIGWRWHDRSKAAVQRCSVIKIGAVGRACSAQIVAAEKKLYRDLQKPSTKYASQHIGRSDKFSREIHARCSGASAMVGEKPSQCVLIVARDAGRSAPFRTAYSHGRGLQ